MSTTSPCRHSLHTPVIFVLVSRQPRTSLDVRRCSHMFSQIRQQLVSFLRLTPSYPKSSVSWQAYYLGGKIPLYRAQNRRITTCTRCGYTQISTWSRFRHLQCYNNGIFLYRVPLRNFASSESEAEEEGEEVNVPLAREEEEEEGAKSSQVILDILNEDYLEAVALTGQKRLDDTSRMTKEWTNDLRESANAGKFERAEDLFKKGVTLMKATPTVCNIMLFCYGKSGQIDKMMALFDKMKKEGLVESYKTYSIMIHFLNLGGKYELMHKMAEEMQASGYPLRVENYTDLISAHSVNNDLEKMSSLVEKMKSEGLKPSLLSYTNMIYTCRRRGKYDDLVYWLEQMVGDGYAPSHKLWYTAIVDLKRSGDKSKLDRVLNLKNSAHHLPNLHDPRPRTEEQSISSRWSKELADLVAKKRFKEAEDVFERGKAKGYPVTDVVLGVMVNCYGKNNRLDKMLETFNQLKQHGLATTLSYLYVYSSVFDALGKAGRLKEMVEYYEEMKQFGPPNVVIYNNLMNAFGIVGDIESMLKYFDELKKQDIPIEARTYNVILSAFVKKGDLDSLSKYYEEMKTVCEPEPIAFNIVIDAYGKAGMLDKAERIFQEMLDLGLEPTEIALSSLVWTCKNTGQSEKMEFYLKKLQELFPQRAARVINKVRQHLSPESRKADPLTAQLNLQIQGLVKKKKYRAALSLILRKLKEGVQGNLITYGLLMHVYSHIGDLKKMIEVFQQLKEKGPEPDESSYGTVIAAFGKEQKFDEMMKYFEELRDMGITPSVTTWNLILNAFGKAGNISAMEEKFQEMQNFGVMPSERTYNILISHYTKAGLLDKLTEIFEISKQKGLADEVTFRFAINGVCMQNRLDLAYKFLNEAVESKILVRVQTLNRLMWLFGSSGQIEKMEETFRRLREYGLFPNPLTFKSMLISYANNAPDRIPLLWQEMIESYGVVPDESYYNTLFEALGRSGQVDKMLEYFQTMKKSHVSPSAHTFSRLLGTLMTHNKLQEMRQIWREMENTDVEPTTSHFNILLKACVNAREWDACWALFSHMKDAFNNKADTHSYTYMVELCGILNRPEKVQELVAELTLKGIIPDKHFLTQLGVTYLLCNKPKEALAALNALKEKFQKVERNHCRLIFGTLYERLPENLQESLRISMQNDAQSAEINLDFDRLLNWMNTQQWTLKSLES